MKRGPIKVSLGKEEADADLREVAKGVADTVVLPAQKVLDVGVAKFREYAGLHWPAGRAVGGDDLKLASFDHRNPYQLRVTLAMVYMAMREVDQGGES